MRPCVRLTPILAMLAVNLMVAPAWPEVFHVGEIDGLFDIDRLIRMLPGVDEIDIPCEKQGGNTEKDKEHKVLDFLLFSYSVFMDQA